MSPAHRGLRPSHELDPLFSPKSVAVVGASNRPESFGGQVFANLIASDDLVVVPVNPRGGVIQGIDAVRSIAEAGDVDVVAVCVGADHVIDTVEQAERAGIKNVVIFSSGFVDAGTPEGVAREATLSEIAARGVRILGPNCLGHIDFRRRIEMHFVPGFGVNLRPGGLGVVAQSGALGFLLTQAQYCGVGFSRWIAPGNSCDVDALDAAGYLLDDANTKAVVLVLESLTRGDALFELGLKARAAGKAVVVHKMGDSEVGAKAAATHTGAVAGSAAVTRQAFRSAGLVVVDHFDELLEVANLFVKGGRALRSGVGVLSASGGAAIVAADEAELSGVPLPELSETTDTVMRGVLPGFGSVANPTDLTGEAAKSPHIFEDCLSAFAQDPGFGLVMAPLTIAWEATTLPRAEAMVRAADKATGDQAVMAVVWMSDWADGPGAEILRSSEGVVMFSSLRIAMRAARLWFDWSGDARTTETGVEKKGGLLQLDTSTADEVSSIIAAATAGQPDKRTLDELESRSLLARVGVPTPLPVKLDTADRAGSIEALSAMSYPVVVKLLSHEIVHKARVGGVALRLVDPDAAWEAASAIGEKFANEASASVIVESMIAGEREWFVGARRDDAFGTVVTMGFGGSDVEKLKPILIVGARRSGDVAIALSSASGEVGEALAAATSVAATLIAIAEQILSLFASVPDVDEVDINPLLQTGDGLIGVDGVLTLRASHTG